MENPITLANRFKKMGYKTTTNGNFTSRECVVHPYIETHHPNRVKMIGKQAVRLMRNMEKLNLCNQKK